MQRLRFRSRVPAPVEELFEWHAREGAFERLIPPWQDVEVIRRDGSIRDGDVLHMQIAAGPLRVNWVALHSNCEYGKQFRDTQIRGPFATWVHMHRTHFDTELTSILDDNIEYELPLVRIGEPFAASMAKREIRRMFRYRHLRTRLDLLRHQQYRHLDRIAVHVSGDHPFASQLAAFLSGGGHRATAGQDADASVDLVGLDRCQVRVRTVHGDRAVIIPDMVVGPSFEGTGVVSRLTSLVRTSDSAGEHTWIAEDDLIGLVYSALIDPQSGNVIDGTTNRVTRFFTDAATARRFYHGTI